MYSGAEICDISFSEQNEIKGYSQMLSDAYNTSQMYAPICDIHSNHVIRDFMIFPIQPGFTHIMCEIK